MSLPVLALLLLANAAAAAWWHVEGTDDTLLRDYFCQKYYEGSRADCTTLRSLVVANHARSVPTLELGDPKKPVMVFIHGWPDSSAIWANQFQHFCGNSAASYFCVALSWFDYHPDVPPRPEWELLWDVQVEAFHRVLSVEMGLRDITLVMHDFGVIVGYQLVYRYPGFVKRIVAMDIGMDLLHDQGGLTAAYGPLPLEEQIDYVRTIIVSFLTHNDTMMRTAPAVAGTPCADCEKLVSSALGWPYWQLVREGDAAWPERVLPRVPRSEWDFSFVPSFPADMPLLFTYGTCQDNTGLCRGCPPCADRSEYTEYYAPWIKWVDERGYGSRSVAMRDTDHWHMCRGSKATNDAIQAFLDELGPAQPPSLVDDGLSRDQFVQKREVVLWSAALLAVAVVAVRITRAAQHVSL